MQVLIRLWPLWLALLAILLGWYVRGWHDSAQRLDHVQDAQRQVDQTNQTEIEDQHRADEVSREITESLHAGPAGQPVSPYLECLLRRVEERRPIADCLPDRVSAPQVSLGALADGARRGPAGRVPGED